MFFKLLKKERHNLVDPMTQRKSHNYKSRRLQLRIQYLGPLRRLPKMKRRRSLWSEERRARRKRALLCDLMERKSGCQCLMFHLLYSTLLFQLQRDEVGDLHGEEGKAKVVEAAMLQIQASAARSGVREQVDQHHLQEWVMLLSVAGPTSEVQKHTPCQLGLSSVQ